jgi:hypothetical protein
MNDAWPFFGQSSLTKHQEQRAGRDPAHEHAKPLLLPALIPATANCLIWFQDAMPLFKGTWFGVAILFIAFRAAFTVSLGQFCPRGAGSH